MHGHNIKKIFNWRRFFLFLFLALAIFLFWYIFLYKPSNNGDWQQKVAVLATAEFYGDLVTVRNVRNFKYPNKENDPIVDYYDKTYDLGKISNVWFITEPFKPDAAVAHTFLSFEFENNEFLDITIESRLKIGEKYNVYKSILRSYPLMYIPTDEKDAVLLRANVRKSNVYLYPIRIEPDQARILLVDMLSTMNELVENPAWYNGIFANCTSRIAHHVSKIWPDKLSTLNWKLWLTGHADELAFEKGFINSDLPVNEARKRYLITPRSQQIGYVDNYSELIRQ